MTVMEWLLFIAVIDGPLIGFVYLVWRSIKKELRK